VEGKRSSIDRFIGFVVVAMVMVGVFAVAAVTWRLIPNHAVALVGILVVVPVFLWGFTQDE